MLITSKGRYALRLMIYLAAFGGDCAEGAGSGAEASGAAGDVGASAAAKGAGATGDTACESEVARISGAVGSASARPAVAPAKISLREVSERERISLKYLEQLVRPLMAAGLLRGVRGKGGGYVLARPAREIRAGDILRAAEGERSAVACEGLDGACGRSNLCSTVKFWTGLEEAIDAYVDGVTLEELARVPELAWSVKM